MNVRRYFLLFVFAWLIFLLVLLPAGQAYRWFESSLSPFKLQAPQGTLWQGQAQMLSIEGIAIGPVNWQLKPLSLLQGRWELQININQQSVLVDGQIELDGADNLRLKLHEFRVPAAMVARLMGQGVHQPQGMVVFDDAVLEWQAGVLSKVDGLLLWKGAALALPDYFELGNVQGKTSMKANTLVVVLSEARDSMVHGQMDWMKQGNIQFKGLVNVRGAPRQWSDRLPVIDADNRAEVRFQGFWNRRKAGQ